MMETKDFLSLRSDLILIQSTYSFQLLTAIVIFSLILIWGVTFAGQEKKVQFQHLTDKDGLSINAVNCILQDRDKLMWFGTQNGLNKYNGKDFIVYNKQFEEDGLNKFILCLHEDEDKDSSSFLWIGTNSTGLIRFDKYKEEFKSFKKDTSKQSISHNRVTVIFQDTAIPNILWIGTEGGGLNRFDKRNFEFHPYKNDGKKIKKTDELQALSHNNVYSIEKDRKGNLWIGTGKGLNLLEKKNQSKSEEKVFIHFSEFDTSSIRTIYRDNSEVLWIGTERHGLWRSKVTLDQNVNNSKINFESVDYATKIKDERPNQFGKFIRCILEDRLSPKILWIGTEEGGLNKLIFESSNKTKIDTVINYVYDPCNYKSISNDRIRSIYQDEYGGLWIGTLGGGVNRLHEEKFYHYYYKPCGNTALDTANDFNIQNNFIWSFFQEPNDKSGTIWIGTSSYGLVKANFSDDFRKAEFENKTSYFKNRNPFALTIRSIYKEKDVIFLGTEGDGLYIFDIKEKKIEPSKVFPLQLRILKILKDRVNTLWIATNDSGLFRYKLNEEVKDIESYPNKVQELDTIPIYALYDDSINETLWIGTMGKGLWGFNYNKMNETIKSLSGGNPLFRVDTVGTTENVYAINQSKHDLWLGTENGLKQYEIDKNSVKVYDQRNGLPDNLIYGILIDARENLWLSTNRGISKFDCDNEAFTNFSIEDGVQGDEFNGGAYLKSNEGWMFLGGINGFNVFHPDSITIKQDTNPPQVIITDFESYGSDTVPTKRPISEKGIELPYTQTSFKISFTTSDFARQGKHLYESKLEGVDTGFVKSTSNFREYSNLKPGEYDFTVYVAAASAPQKSLKIIIKHPPFGESSAFIPSLIISLILIFSLIFALYRYYKNKEIHFHKEMEGQLETLGEIGSKIASILDLEKIKEEISIQIQKIMDASAIAMLKYDEHNEQLIWIFYVEGDEEEKPDPIPITKNNSFSVYCFNNEEDIQINDLDKEYQNNKYNISFEKKAVKGQPTKTLIFLPLVVNEKCIGVLTVQSYNAYAYTNHQYLWLKSFAPYIAIALENATINRELLAKTSKLKQASDDLNEIEKRRFKFFSIISHELRNPITVIKSSLELLQKKLLFQVSENQRKLFETAILYAEKAAKLVRKYLDLVRIKETLSEPKFEYKSLKDIMLRIIDEAARIETKNIQTEFKIEISSDDRLETILDAEKIDSVIYQLVENAIKYTDEKGIIIVSAQSEKEEIVVKVRNPGKAIPEELCNKIFEPFYSTGKGTGIGLYIAKNYVELHGGKIWVEPIPNIGNTFIFTLPIKERDYK